MGYEGETVGIIRDSGPFQRLGEIQAELDAIRSVTGKNRRRLDLEREKNQILDDMLLAAAH